MLIETCSRQESGLKKSRPCREKVCIRETVSRVRIPQSPQWKKKKILCLHPSKHEGFFFLCRPCDDLDRRMSKHLDGLSKYTASKGPWRLVYFEMVSSRTGALKQEKEIKSTLCFLSLFLLIQLLRFFMTKSYHPALPSGAPMNFY